MGRLRSETSDARGIITAGELPKHLWEISGAVDDAGDVDPVGGGLVENYVGTNDKRSKPADKVFSALPKFRLVRERLQSAEQLVKHIVCRSRVMLADVVANLVEIGVGQ